MIDEKRLDTMARQIEGLDSLHLDDGPTGRQLIRLARLGLWAEKHGVPSLKTIRTGKCCDSGMMVCCSQFENDAQKALATLPTDSGSSPA